MTFKLLLFLLVIGFAIFMVAVPAFKIMRMLFSPKRDPLAEAKMKYEAAQKEAAAARLNKETEKVYSELYEEILEDDTERRNKL